MVDKLEDRMTHSFRGQIKVGDFIPRVPESLENI